MTNKKIILPIFILVCLVQLYVPATMIFEREDILDTGTEFKFRSAPVDPNDPFRGKYVTLSFEESSVLVASEDNWQRGETIFVSLTTDEEGFAKIESVSRKRPVLPEDFVQARANYIYSTTSDSLRLDILYPFNRFYMEESKAYDAEIAYRRVRRDNSKTTYALINIKDGEAVVKDLLIDGVPIKEVVEKDQQEQWEQEALQELEGEQEPK